MIFLNQSPEYTLKSSKITIFNEYPVCKKIIKKIPPPFLQPLDAAPLLLRGWVRLRHDSHILLFLHEMWRRNCIELISNLNPLLPFRFRAASLLSLSLYISILLMLSSPSYSIMYTYISLYLSTCTNIWTYVYMEMYLNKMIICIYMLFALIKYSSILYLYLLHF